MFIVWMKIIIMRLYFVKIDLSFISASVPSGSQGSWVSNYLSCLCYDDDYDDIFDYIRLSLILCWS